MGSKLNFDFKVRNFLPFTTINVRHTWLLLFIARSILGISGEYGSQKVIIRHPWHVVRGGDTEVNVRHSPTYCHVFLTEKFTTPFSNCFAWTCTVFARRTAYFNIATRISHALCVLLDVIFVMRGDSCNKQCLCVGRYEADPLTCVICRRNRTVTRVPKIAKNDY